MAEYWHGLALPAIIEGFFGLGSGRHEADVLADSAGGIVSSSGQTESSWSFADARAHGAVRIDAGYLNWRFYPKREKDSEDRWSTPFTEISWAGTVRGRMIQFRDAEAADPISSWEEMVSAFRTNRSTINNVLSGGATATVTDARGNSYTAAPTELPEVTSVADFVNWLLGWWPSGLLTEAGDRVFSTDGEHIQLSILGSAGTSMSATLTFDFLLA